MNTSLIQTNATTIPLADNSVHMCVTSPPYWSLRDYGVDAQLGLEPTPEEYVQNMVAVFREVRRVMRPDGTLWLNLGDSYAANRGYQVPDGKWDDVGNNHGMSVPSGLKPKDLVGIPWRVAFALQADGWWLRSDIIWSKPNPMPESVTDRPTKAHEYLFLLSPSQRYYYDADAVREALRLPDAADGTRIFGGNNKHGANYKHARTTGRKYDTAPSGRNRRTVWHISTKPYSAGVQTSHLRRVVGREVCDGMRHIVLPSCRVHGGEFVPLAREFCDEREVDYWHHIQRICNHLYEVPFDGCVPTDQQRALGYVAQSSGYFPRSYSPTAIDHNNETHRMALALDSTPPYIPFFEILSRTDDRRALLSSFVQHLCIYGNSILVDDCDATLLSRIPHRIVDTRKNGFYSPVDTSCTCLFYEYYTRKPDHFATYPPTLIEPCIKAGTSEHGVCRRCGNQWVREISKTQITGNTWGQRKEAGEGMRRGYNRNRPKEVSEFASYENKTLGWRPGCSCFAGEPVPATVLDPFSGAATTGLVCQQLNRNYIGLDLSMEYHGLARERLGLVAMERWQNGAQKVQNTDYSGLPMFTE